MKLLGNSYDQQFLQCVAVMNYGSGEGQNTSYLCYKLHDYYTFFKYLKYWVHFVISTHNYGVYVIVYVSISIP